MFPVRQMQMHPMGKTPSSELAYLRLHKDYWQNVTNGLPPKKISLPRSMRANSHGVSGWSSSYVFVFVQPVFLTNNTSFNVTPLPPLIYIIKDERGALTRRVRHLDSKLRGGIGLITPLTVNLWCTNQKIISLFYLFRNLSSFILDSLASSSLRHLYPLTRRVECCRWVKKKSLQLLPDG